MMSLHEVKKFLKRMLHVYIRHYVLYLYVLYFRKIWGMDIHSSVRISLKAKLDKTNPRGVHVGAHSYIAFGVVVLSHDMTRALHCHTYIGERCFIGANAIILPGVRIGNQCVVGAGSVVTRDVPCNCIVAGNPAKIIRSGIKTRELGILDE